MAIHVALTHRTTYRYDRRVSLGPQVIRLRPAPHCRTPILSYSLKVDPEKHFINWQQDPFSNYLGRFMFSDPTDHLDAVVEVVAEMAVYNPFDFFLEPTAEFYPFIYEPGVAHDLAPYLKRETQGALFEDIVSGINLEKQRTIDFLVGLNVELQQRISYLVRMEPGVQTPEETLAKSSGSCRDTAWLLCQLLRSCGIAARFVSGYLIQLKPDVKSLDGPTGPEEDFTDLHAWTEVYLPGAGWIGFDPTSGLLAGEGHIPLACTPEPSSAAPISGTTEECETEFDVAMSLQRIYESPRVTKPYAETDWQEIVRLGHRVDERLEEGDVRLTVGGEPTFVSLDDMEGEEWNSAALGPTKRKLAGGLIRRLRARFASGALLHFGQGKWYPGERLPRWAFGCFWRKDGVPVWENIDLVANEETDYGVSSDDSALFFNALTTRLGVDSRFVLPAYEDSWYYLWKERRLPSNVDPLKSNLADELERARLARVFEQGLNKMVGHVLPIKRDGTAGWLSGAWFLRTEDLYLVPGDSPIGFRLPLDSLPWVKASEYPWDYEPDPLAERSPLAQPPPRDSRLYEQAGLPSDYRKPLSEGAMRPQFVPQGRPDISASALVSGRAPRLGESAPWIVRTAMAIEPRDGKLNVFMPPLTSLEDYLDLLAAVEETAQYLGLPVIVEGYPPPGDSRLNVIKVTPERGVIEVNIHPANSWDEMIDITTGVYEEARQTRLGTEKFMLDGRHSGTGGGNHVVVGGSTPADSPFFRRPDLLRSLVNYWQNHPSLSYLFSGLFIGPTCQSPRVDEARNDALYELGIAFEQIPDKGRVPPWLVDRIFRYILVDVTGNVRRAEFCIDKLYSPGGGSGRLGLLELRAFEMPPHERMSLVQQLLVRALIAEFWDQPYRQPLVPWGTELHDRFLLPHFVWQDFCDVVTDMNDAGHAFRTEWFAPHLEFRFPFVGETNYREARIELRRAIEPWHVLGEEGYVGGAVRYVDSSLERLQVKITGLVGSRYHLLCNNVPVPLHSTGTVGEYVAGVRYRAWQPATCLHPTIGVQTPLVFDLYDKWNAKTVAGCTYHVSNPGGQNPSTFPVNAYEAESRRLSRFSPYGHTPGLRQLPPVSKAKEFPFTLDLRQHSVA
ncbi:MAG TPA: transglutaminase family protein [Terrimicrobiaceae bacterium]